jgi:hypothetical protein
MLALTFFSAMNTIPKEALEQMRKEGWPTKEEVLEYWRIHDAGGNVIPDRVEANEDRYRDYEPEQAYGTTEDFRRHQQYGGTREDY